jgi:hypothetical protein
MKILTLATMGQGMWKRIIRVRFRDISLLLAIAFFRHNARLNQLEIFTKSFVNIKLSCDVNVCAH